jgi:hypothetical protein
MNYFSLLAKKKLDIFFAGHKIESMDEKLTLLFNGDGERGQALPLEWHGSTTCFHDTSKHIPQ